MCCVQAISQVWSETGWKILGQCQQTWQGLHIPGGLYCKVFLGSFITNAQYFDIFLAVLWHCCLGKKSIQPVKCSFGTTEWRKSQRKKWLSIKTLCIKLCVICWLFFMRTLALGYSLQLSMNELVAEVSVGRNATALFLFLNQWPAIGFMLGMCRSSNPKFEYCQNLTILGKSKIWRIYRLVYVEFRHTVCCINLSFIAIRCLPCRSKQMCIEWLFLDVCIISNAKWDRDLVFGFDLVFSIYRHR